MAKYIVWLYCDNSSGKQFPEIVNAATKDDAKRIILQDKRFKNPVITDIYTAKKEAKT